MPHRLAHRRPFASDRCADAAWHLLAVLLRLRRPALPAELAAHCVPAVSPALVILLCRISDSPLRIGADGLVTVSTTAAAAFAAFVFADLPRFVPRACSVEVPGWGKDRSFPWGVVGRKRKGDELSAVAKRSVPPGADDRPTRCADKQISAISSSGVLGGVGAEGKRFHTGISHAAKLNDSNCYDKLETCLSIPSEDQTMISLPEVDVLPMNHECDAVKLENHEGDDDADISNQVYSLIHELLHKPSDFPVQQLQPCDLHASEINENETEFEALTLEKFRILAAEAVLDDPTGKSEENAPTVCPISKISLQENPTGFTLGAQGGKNIAKVVSSISCKASESEKFVDNGDNHGTDNLDGKDNCNAVDAHVSQSSVLPVNSFSTQVHMSEQVSKREPISGSLILEKSSIKNDDLVSIKRTEACVGTLDSNQDGKEHALKQIRKKYVRRKLRSQNHDAQEKVAESTPAVDTGSVIAKKFPHFDSFIVEDEEGSGGYGTVYKASRKNDRKTFAIKCPHPNANTFHVNNELKMLERFGGRSFIIKLEGSFKSGKSECFVLEHVEHDRPEVLKREIEVSELQWYCYCLFKALSSLHKQGVVHRDVKPGNFLFSRKVNKGYLIDFNLALDLHSKLRLNNRDLDSKGGPVGSSPVQMVSPSTGSRKALNSQHLEAVGNERNKESRRAALLNGNKKGVDKGHLDVFSSFSGKNKNKNQGTADGSGLTSVKDATSTRTISAERMRQPIPTCSRKELRNMLQEVMQSANKQVPPPVTQRKRIPAPLGKTERLLALLTPMPLQLNGSPVCGPGQLKYKGAAREKMEGPCVGTKGFRAPEVLFRSRYQGCKIDMWSAGVTILYLIIGRMPFSGDPEQNIKEIAKMKGSEDLWEVARIHDRESSFPTDLYDIQSIQSFKLRDWCKKNTKKQEFLDEVPDTLFDLVDRCLAVNPRQRISSEEALMHDFIFPCREELRKQRMVRLSRDTELDLHTKL